MIKTKKLLRCFFCVLFALAICLTSRCFAQSNSFSHFGIREGLPSVEVYNVFQDKTGFVWFATDNGVVRWDGRNIETFQKKEGLPDPVVFDFYQDDKARIWFRSYSGRLSWFKDNIIHQYVWNDTIVKLCKSGLLRQLSVDSLDQVWINTDNFTGKITPDGKVIEQLSDSTKFDYWIAGNEYYVTWRGRRFVSFDKSLFEIKDNKMVRVFSATDRIISLFADLDNTLWIGYLNTDAERYRTDDFKNPELPEFLKGQSISKMMQDDQRGFWISTLKNGVYHIPNYSFIQHKAPSLTGTKIALSQGEDVMIGDDKGHLVLMDVKTLKIKRQVTLQNKSIVAAAVDAQGKFWVASERDVSIFDASLELKNTLTLHLNGFCKDRYKNLCGFDNMRVIKFDDVGNMLTIAILNDFHRSILISDPFIVMGSRTGFDVFDPAFHLLKTPEAFKDYKISSLTNLNDSTILVATLGSGFFVVSKRDWSADQYIEDNRFTARSIYSAILIDSMLWLGTEKGVAMTSVSSLIRKNPRFTFLGSRSGLIDDKIDLMLAADTSVWIFSGNGFSIVPRDTRQINRSNTTFYVKELLVNNVNMALGVDHALTPEQNNVQINFGFVNLTQQNLFVRTRLNTSGVWNYSKERTLNFNRLAPGHYSLELGYSEDSIHWTDAKTNINFSISTPWWQQWYSQSIFYSLILLLGYIFFRVRISLLEQKNIRLRLVNDHKQNIIQAEIETMENERSRIAKDLHDGAGMNLTVLKLKLYQLFLNEPKPEADDLVESLNATILEIREIIYNLTPPGLTFTGLVMILKNYVARTIGNSAIPIEIQHFGKEISDTKISLFSFRILQELLSNSIKHSGATGIKIHINAFEDELNILYQDNGTGFSPDAVKKGSGLLNIESRLEIIKGKMLFSSNEFGVTYNFTIRLGGRSHEMSNLESGIINS